MKERGETGKFPGGKESQTVLGDVVTHSVL